MRTIVFPKGWLLLAIGLMMLVFWGMLPVAPACGGPGYEGMAWKLSQAFAEAIHDQEERYQRYLLPGLAFVFLLLGIILYWYLAHRKLTERKTWHFTAAGDSNTQRGWMRLSIEQEILFAREEDQKYKRATVINMSGGGLLLATDEEMEKNDELEIILELTPGEELKLTGRVLRVTKNDADDNKNPYMVGLQFMNIKQGEQDKIVKMILQKQQGSVIEEKRKAKGECVLCGRPLPEADIGVNIHCPKCSVYKE